MPKTVTVTLSDAVIKKYAADLDVSELKDPRHPLRFRYRKDRARGSWHVVRYAAGAKWKKAGNWPDLPARLMLESLPKVMQRLAEDAKASAVVDAGGTAAQVLEWYSDRVRGDSTLSSDRRGTVRSVIKCHLLPKLGQLRLSELNKATVDKLLYVPLQAEYSLSHVKSVFVVLKTAFKRACRLDVIAADPLSSVTFGDFTVAKIGPKGVRLRHGAIADLLAAWSTLFESASSDVVFALLMLAHGSRITETRLARWHHFDLMSGEWFIPAVNNKGRRDHVLPLTAQALALLNRYREAQQARGYSGAFLFPSPARKSRPLSRAQSFEIFRRLGAGEWTSHDLRKLARTCWAELGIDSLTGKALLNHSLTLLEATYVQTHGNGLKRSALVRWHEFLDARGFAAIHDKTAARRAAMNAPSEAADWLVCGPN